MSRLKVLTIGTFDIPHVGHAAFLRDCKSYGEVVVGVNSDRFVLEYKGKRPVFTAEERMAFIQGMGYDALLNDGPGIDLVNYVRPDTIAIGSDWMYPKDYLGQIGVDSLNGIHLVFIPYTKGISTSQIIERVHGG